MVGIAEVREPELGTEGHRPVPLDRRHAHEESGRAVALAQRSQELPRGAEVLEDVREDRDVEGSVGLVGEHVRLDVGDARMGELRSGRREGPGARVDADDDRARALGDVSCDASDAAAHVEHAFPLAHAFDEEVVVPGEPVLGVLAASVVDCAAVHRDVRVAVDVEQLSQRLGLVRLRADRLEPEPEERPPEPEGEEETERSQRQAAPDASGDAPRGPGATIAHATSRAPR